MVLERRYDPEIARQSATGCLNDGVLAGAVSHALALSTTSASVGPLAAGVYRVFLHGGDPLQTVVLKTGDERVMAETPVSARNGARGSALMQGSQVERIRVLREKPYLAAMLTHGTGMLYLVPLVMT